MPLASCLAHISQHLPKSPRSKILPLFLGVSQVALGTPGSQSSALLPKPTSTAVPGGLSTPKLWAFRGPVGSPYPPASEPHPPCTTFAPLCPLCPAEPLPVTRAYAWSFCRALSTGLRPKPPDKSLGVHSHTPQLLRQIKPPPPNSTCARPHPHLPFATGTIRAPCLRILARTLRAGHSHVPPAHLTDEKAEGESGSTSACLTS